MKTVTFMIFILLTIIILGVVGFYFWKYKYNYTESIPEEPMTNEVNPESKDAPKETLQGEELYTSFSKICNDPEIAIHSVTNIESSNFLFSFKSLLNYAIVKVTKDKKGY